MSGDRPRPWIATVAPGDATGLLAEHYAAAVKRAGKVFWILRVQSLSPESLGAGIELYKTLMFGPSGLSREERELLAVSVSAANHCHY
jgi:alkylhydroperoxidase family enzyme